MSHSARILAESLAALVALGALTLALIIRVVLALTHWETGVIVRNGHMYTLYQSIRSTPILLDSCNSFSAEDNNSKSV